MALQHVWTLNIGDLQNGQSGYAVSWAAAHSKGNYYLTRFNSVSPFLEATVNMYVTRIDNRLWFVMPEESEMHDFHAEPSADDDHFVAGNVLPASPYRVNDVIVLPNSYVLFHKLRHEGIEYPGLINMFDTAQQAEAYAEQIGLQPGAYEVMVFLALPSDYDDFSKRFTGSASDADLSEAIKSMQMKIADNQQIIELFQSELTRRGKV
jgi:hypothetical protein